MRKFIRYIVEVAISGQRPGLPYAEEFLSESDAVKYATKLIDGGQDPFSINLVKQTREQVTLKIPVKPSGK